MTEKWDRKVGSKDSDGGRYRHYDADSKKDIYTDRGFKGAATIDRQNARYTL